MLPSEIELVLQKMAGPKEIQVEETGPDFVIQNMEKILTKSRSAVFLSSKIL